MMSKYSKLRDTIDDISIIDDHGHPGFAEFFETVPENKSIAFAVDKYKSPKDSSAGFPYLEDLHYEAYEKLYGLSKKELDNPGNLEEITNIYEIKRKEIRSFIDDIMDKSGVETLIANYAIPDSLKNKSNIKFIPVIDSVIFPFDNTYLKERFLANSFVGSYEFILSELKKKYSYVEEGFDKYLEFVDRVLEGYIDEKCVGFKLSTSYARNTVFNKVTIDEARASYESAMKGNLESYTKLQDFLVWYCLDKAVDYDMPVQFHFAVTDNYVKYFDPLNLSNIFEDEKLKALKLVILHGGYPRYKNSETLALGGLTPNNVYIDISGRIMFANHPKIIAKMLQTWLEKPALWNKIIYGSDVLWGERYIYTCSKTARDAVYLALENMIDENIINEEIAIGISKKILRENAIELYKL